MMKMKKQQFILSVAVAVLLFSLIGTAAASDGHFGGGAGTADSPYLIDDAADLNKIRDDLSAHYQLNGNIDLSNHKNFLPIGDESDPFTGSFAGGTDIQGAPYKISNLEFDLINHSSACVSHGSVNCIPDACTCTCFDCSNGCMCQYYYRGGLFGYTEGATFSNIIIEGFNLTGYYRMGGLAGQIHNTTVTYCDIKNSQLYSGQAGLIGIAYDSTIEDCLSSDIKVVGRTAVGGISGAALNTTITNCHADGYVEGKQEVGGLVGSLSGGSVVSGSSSSCTVQVNASMATSPHEPLHAGGLVGLVGNSDIIDSYATGDVISAGDCTGGLIGLVMSGNLESCYATGDVVNTEKYTGGLVGDFWNGNISGCYAEDGIVSGTQDVGGLIGRNFYGTIEDSYASAIVIGNENVGGLIGLSTPMNSFNAVTNSSVSGQASVDGGYCVGGLIGAVVNGETSVTDSSVSDNVKITGNDAVYNENSGIGGLIGYVCGSENGRSPGNIKISGSYVTDNVSVEGNYRVGGLVGIVQYGGSGSIENSYVDGEVSVTGYVKDVGGLAGNLYTWGTGISSVSDSYVAGNVTVSGGNIVGGLVGYSYDSDIKNSFTAGDVSGNQYVGGLVGLMQEMNGKISYCYATGDVLGNDLAGGLVGWLSGGSVNDSMALNEFVSLNESSSSVNVHPLFGEVQNGQFDNCSSWMNISNRGELFSENDIYTGTVITSRDVWDSYPGSVWENWPVQNKNTFKWFKLPVPDWQIEEITADARHLIPADPEEKSSPNPGSNNNNNKVSSGGSTAEKPSSPSETVPGFTAPVSVTVILFFAIAIACFAFNVNRENKE